MACLLIIALLALLFLKGWLEYKNFLVLNPRYKIKGVELVERKLSRWSIEMHGSANIHYEWNEKETTFIVYIKDITNPKETLFRIENFKQSINAIKGTEINNLIYKIKMKREGWKEAFEQYAKEGENEMLLPDYLDLEAIKLIDE